MEDSDSGSKDEEEPDSPRDGARAIKFAGPETLKINQVAFKDSDVLEAVEKIKTAKANVGKEEVGENTVNCLYGTISSHPHNKGKINESFLPDSGASLSIIGLTAAKENNLKITRPKATRKVIEASGNALDIIGGD